MADLVSMGLNWIHYLGVALWIGGAFFIDFILNPSSRVLPPDQIGKLIQAVVRRFTPVAWTSIFLIAITGILRANTFGMLDIGILTETTYGNYLLAKMFIFLIMIIMGLIITTIGRKIPKIGTPEYSQKAMKQIKRLSEINIILGFIVILLATGI